MKLTAQFLKAVMNLDFKEVKQVITDSPIPEFLERARQMFTELTMQPAPIPVRVHNEQRPQNKL